MTIDGITPTLFVALAVLVIALVQRSHHRTLNRYVEYLEREVGQLREDFDEDRAARMAFMSEANSRLEDILKHLERRNGKLVEEPVFSAKGTRIGRMSGPSNVDDVSPIVENAGTPGIGGNRD